MIDLHLHSTASDGTCSPEELAERGRSLAVMALTDHDCTDGCARFIDACRELGVTGLRLPGIELSVNPGEGYGQFHMLGLGIDFNKAWTADSTMAIWSIILVSVWRNMGYYMVLYLAALQGIPRELMEAATVDGANKWQQFLHVTLPQLKPTTFFVSVMMVISCFKIYDVVAIMTDGGPGRSTKMLVTYIYDEAFVKVRYGQASAISMVLLVIVLLVTIIQFSSEKKFSND